MSNPYAIHVYTDGASAYDSQQSGGIGYVIEFPDSVDTEPLQDFLNENKQGIHRLEMIAIVYAMDTLIKWYASNSEKARQVSGVIFHTDRISITDEYLLGPYRVDQWRKNKWMNKDGTPVKHKDLIDEIDKKRKKLSGMYGGRVEICYLREKRNKKADKLSKQGKITQVKGRRILSAPKQKVGRRLFKGDEVNYKSLSVGDALILRAYLKTNTGNKYSVSCDVCDTEMKGGKIRVLMDYSLEKIFQRHHFFQVSIVKVNDHSIEISSEIKRLEEL